MLVWVYVCGAGADVTAAECCISLHSPIQNHTHKHVSIYAKCSSRGSCIFWIFSKRLNNEAVVYWTANESNDIAPSLPHSLVQLTRTQIHTNTHTPCLHGQAANKQRNVIANHILGLRKESTLHNVNTYTYPFTSLTPNRRAYFFSFNNNIKSNRTKHILSSTIFII